MKRILGFVILAAAFAALAFVAAGPVGGAAADKGGKSGKAVKPAPERPVADSVAVAAGAKTYAGVCATCHGPGGKGDGPGAAALNPKPRNFTDPKAFKTKSDEEMFAVIQKGGGAAKLSAAMPAWGSVLKRDQIWQVIAYIRTLAPKEAKPAVEPAK